MVNKIIKNRIFRFVIGGGVAATFNLFLMFVMIEWLEFKTPLLRNIANVVSIELSLILSFFIYRIWVWPGGSWSFREVLYKQIPLYHLSAGMAVITRIFILFPLLDWFGISYQINTLIGVLLSATINYVMSDKLVFRHQIKHQSQKNVEALDLSNPEGLEPALQKPKSTRSTIVSSNLINRECPVDLFSVVIPAYNEEGSIRNTVESISQCLEHEEINYEILVINDNSRDHTEQVLRKMTMDDPKVRYLNSYYPNGFGFAVRCGLENFQGDAVAIVMADSSDLPKDIAKYYYKLKEGYECIFGSRFIKGGKVIDYPIHKLIINRMANFFVKSLFGISYNDTTNAFKAYRREVIEGISPLLSHHFNLTVEMPLKAIIRKYSYTTIPITWTNRKTGVSKLKIKEMGSRYLFIVLYIFLEKMLSRGDYVRQHENPKTMSRR